MTKKAFTLAEVLVTLGIIGVVAAMTMPVLMNNARDKELVARFKKAYSLLSQATIMASMEYPVEDWNMRAANLSDTEIIYNYYKPHLSITQDCGCSKRALGCWSKDATRTINGSIYTYGHEKGIGDTYCAVRLADGMNLSFDTWGPSDLGVTSSSDVFFFYVDVNGDKKPNVLGKDVFQFVVTKEKGALVPAGADNNTVKCTKNDTSREAGIDCAAKVLAEDKIDY